MSPAPCPKCARAVVVHVGYDLSIFCSACYDGAPDSGPQIVSAGLDVDAVIADWNEQVDDWLGEQEAKRDGLRSTLNIGNLVAHALGGAK